MKKELKLIHMSDIEIEEVKWLWHPYIPIGKVTIIQGDPGEGKTSFVLAVISALTLGEALPECDSAAEPMNVIYQTAEDGLADTIKPRLEAAGADCSRVLVIDDSYSELTLCDERLEQAIRETGAKLIVLDPLQAYLGNDVDMHRANEVRPVMKRIAAMAERTQCAVILIGHMNKMQGQKSSYRGLGSIDFRASARSVLVVGRLKSGDTVRVVAQDKNSLAPEGPSIAFELSPEHGFQWKGLCEATVEDILSGSGKVQTKTMQMGRGYYALMIREALGHSQWMGEGTWDTERFLAPYERIVPGCESDAFLTTVIYKLGWMPFLILVAVFAVLMLWLLLRCTKQKSQLGRMIVIAVVMSLSVQAMVSVVWNMGFALLSASFPLIIGNLNTVLNMGLIGLALSVFRGDSIARNSENSKKERQRIRVRLVVERV